MTKDELARELAVSKKLHLSTATVAVHGLIDIIKDALARGEEISLRGFATIKPVKANERPARIIKTGETVIIPAHTTVKIKLSKEFKSYLNNEPLEL